MRRHTFLSMVALWLLVACHGNGASSPPESAKRPSVSDPRAAAAAWSRALVEGSSPAWFEWVRPESRILLVHHPEIVDRVRARVAALGDVAKLEIVVRGERAALFDREKPTVEPILLLLDDGGWRVDVVEVEKSYAPAAPGRLAPPENKANPYRRLVPPPARMTHADLGETDLYGEPIEDAIARLSRSDDAESHRLLGEILLRNCWLVDEAMAQFEAWARKTGQPGSLERFANVAAQVGVPDRAMRLAEEYELVANRVLAILHQRAQRFDQSTIYIERIMSRTPAPWRPVDVSHPASPAASPAP